MDRAKYKIDQLVKQSELLQKHLSLQDDDKDIWNLEYMITTITPYSRYWNMGVIRSLRRAIKALERENELNTQK